MAMYAPIRDAFRDLNELMKDSRQWKERHATASADREFKQQMLTSQLSQQRFNNEMAIEEMDLRKQGQNRLADQAAFNRMHTNRQWKADQLAAGDDRQLNEARLKKMESEQKELDLDLQQRKKNIAAREGMMGRITKEIFQDPVARAESARDAIASKLGALQSTYKSLDPNNNRNTVRRAIINEKINATKSDLAKEMVFVDTPEAKAKTWREQANKARELASQWSVKHGNVKGVTNPIVKNLMDIADDYDARAEAEMDHMFKRQKAAAAAAEKDRWDTRYDRFAKHYGSLDANNQIFLDPAAKGRVAIAQKWSQKAADSGKFTNGEELLQGFAAVDTVEANFFAELNKRFQDFERGLFTDEEAQENIAALVNDFIYVYGYDPRGANVPEVLPAGIDIGNDE